MAIKKKAIVSAGTRRSLWRQGGADFLISTSPTSQTVKGKKATSCTVSVSPSGSFIGPVSLTAVVSGPSGGPTPTVSFNPAQIRNRTASATLKVTPSNNSLHGDYVITITGKSGSTQHSTSVSLTVNK
jgi:hypothetical protein